MTSKRTRHRYTAEFKAEVAPAVLTGRQSLAELAAHYQLAVAQTRAGSCNCASRRPRSLPKRLPPVRCPRCRVALRRYRPATDGKRVAKKNAAPMSTAQQCALVHAPDLEGSSVQASCQALGLARSSFYYQPRGESAENLALMRLLDEEFTLHNFKGVLGMRDHLRLAGHAVNAKRICRLVRLMGHEPVYPNPRLSVPGHGVTPCPYLLRDRPAMAPNEVWSTDITYVLMAKGFLYLAAVLDWHSCHVLNWQLSNTLEVGFCLQALDAALRRAPAPYIFNSDQGSQFTSLAYEQALLTAGCRDGRGRATDNAFIERLWRTVKWEHIYLNPADNGQHLFHQLDAYFAYYNYRRPHQSLRGKTPAQVYQTNSAFNHHHIT